MVDEQDDIEFGDDENYRSGKEVFSHSQLLMIGLRNCLQAGCKEMRAGYFNDKKDKHGNSRQIYMEDTRKVFIESIKTLLVFMGCYYDAEAEEIIYGLEECVDKRKKKLLTGQLKWWNGLNKLQKHNLTRQGKMISESFLNSLLPWNHEFVQYELEVYRRILNELNNLAYRKNFFSSEGGRA